MKKYVFLTVVLAFICACGNENSQKQLVHSVIAIHPQNASNEMVKNFSGVVKENSEISLGFKTAGQIERILVKEGDHVKKGQLLATLDAKDYQLGVDASQIQYDQLEKEVARLKQLYESKTLSGNDYEKAVSGLEQVKIQLQVNRNKLSYTRLYAPQEGLVQSVNFEPSEMVNAGTPVFTLLDVHQMEVEISLPQSVAEMRSRFESVYCIMGEIRHPLHLVSILPKADNNQLYTARFLLDGKLSAGQNVDVLINIAATNKVGGCTLPIHAIFEDEGRSYVWVVGKDSAVTRREVTIGGVDDNGNVVLTSGLMGDELVVKAGVDALQDNEKVKVIEEASKTNIGGLI